MASKEDYEEQEILLPISSNKTVGDEDQRRIDVKRIGKVVGVTAAGVAVGGPLLTVVSTTVAAALCVAAVGLPLVLLISPVLFIPCFMLVGTTAGFSLTAVMAYAGVSTLKWVFRYARDRPLSEGKTEETVSRGGDYEEEEDVVAKTFDEGWKQELHQKDDAVGRERVEEAAEEEEDQSTKDEEIKVTGDEDDKDDVVDSASSQSDKDKEKDKKEPSSSQKSKKQKNPKKK
ncbi:unnamed protein product [Amaranthus hypochondriacus]